MGKLTFPVTPLIKEELVKASVRHPWKNITVDEESYGYLRELVENGGYGHLTEDERHAITVGCCYTHPDHKDKHLEPLRHPIKKASYRYASYLTNSLEWNMYSMIVFRAAVLILLVLILLSPAHCQTSQIDVITFRNAAGSNVKSFAAPFNIKEGTNVTFSAAGSTLTINAAGGGGSFYQTFQSAAVALTQRATANFFGAIVCSDNAGASRTDCALAQNNAVANQYLTGIDSGGNFLRKQIDYGELSNVPSTFAPASHNLLSAAHGDTAAHSVVRGDLIAGIGASPVWTAVAKGGTNTYPKWNASGDVIASSLAASGVGTPTACTNQFVTGFTLNSDAAPVSTCTTDVLASAQHANQGTTTTVLHGNAAGNPSFAAVTSADTTGTFPATAHNLLSATHGDTTAGTVARGDLISGQGASATWTRLSKGAAGACLMMDGTATDVTWNTCPGAAGGASTADSFITISHDADLTGERTLAGTSTHITITDGGANNSVTLDTGSNVPLLTANNTHAAGTIDTFDTIKAKYWGGAPIFDATQYSGTDMCDKIGAVLGDAAFTGGTGPAIIDARGFSGNQNCASTNPFQTTRPTKWIFGPVHISLTRQVFPFGPPSGIAAPSAPGLSTSTSGGSLAATTQFGVKVTLLNINGETTGSTEATITTGAGATNSITVTAPTGTLGAVCYNVYSATPIGSGWKLNNTPGCIPLGTNYIIQTVGAGVVVNATNTAWNDLYEIEGAGESTIWSMDNVNAAFTQAQSNIWVHDMMFTNRTATVSTNQVLQVNTGLNNVNLYDLTFSGGGNAINLNGNNHVRIWNIRCGNFTVSASCISTTGGGAQNFDVRIWNVEMVNSVWPTGGNLQGVINLNGCNDCAIDGVTARNLDISNLTNGAAVIAQGAIVRMNISNINCTGLVNADCVAVTGGSVGLPTNVNISNVMCSKTVVGTGAGVGTNSNNGDCIDIFHAGRININNAVAQDMGLVGGLRFPCYEFYQSNEVNATNINCNGSTGEGVNMFGCTGCTIANSHMNLNGKSGILIQDGTATVSCNGTTTVTFTSGFSFGPWPIGTPITINGAAHTVGAVPTSTATLTTAAACTSGAGQAFVISTQDTNLSNNQTDDNGTAAVAATSCSGIDILGGSSANITGGSANDNRPTASKTQCWGIDSSGTTATFSAVNFDPSGNKTGTISDTAAKGMILRNTGDGTWMQSGLKFVSADFTTAANTNLQTITGLVFTLPALTAAHYSIDCHLIYSQATAGAAGSGFGVQAATFSPTNVFGTGIMGTSATAVATGALATLTTTTATNIVTGTPPTATNMPVDLHVNINNPSNASAQVVNIMVKTANTSDLITVRKDSFCSLQTVR